MRIFCLLSPTVMFFFRFENLDDFFSFVCNDQYSLHHASICSLLLYIQQFTVRLCSDGAVVKLVTWRSKASNIIQSREMYCNMTSYELLKILRARYQTVTIGTFTYGTFCDSRHMTFLDVHAYICYVRRCTWRS